MAFLVLTLVSLTVLTQAQNPAFASPGHGNIHVVNGTSITNPGNYLGCMADDGAFTLDTCAIFTHVNSTLASQLGYCNWHDPTKPTNVDAIYGQNVHAWSCASGLTSDGYYTLVSSYEQTPMIREERGRDGKLTSLGQRSDGPPIICHQNLDCFIDVKGIPTKPEDRLPLWEFYWGSQQVDVPAGHTRGMFLWVPVDQE
ncbi:hypothetical protein DL546_006473 [Coniochaeta pulveracea]|uniref:Ecp2 effector protein domain-containing protein n=1 Tax=Coniochaeta pulveracea TaxID=177199 RepID=A0A420YIU5_9PEZI|nr:hypothetical protein DL546_006473 [Coniochaeta pulveracea]